MADTGVSFLGGQSWPIKKYSIFYWLIFSPIPCIDFLVFDTELLNHLQQYCFKPITEYIILRSTSPYISCNAAGVEVKILYLCLYTFNIYSRSLYAHSYNPEWMCILWNLLKMIELKNNLRSYLKILQYWKNRKFQS